MRVFDVFERNVDALLLQRAGGGFQVDDDAGESLRQRIVDVACDAVAFPEHGSLARLLCELG